MGEKCASLNAVRTSRMHWAQSVSTINNLRVCHLVSYFGRRRLSLLACIGHLFKQPPPSLSLSSATSFRHSGLFAKLRCGMRSTRCVILLSSSMFKRITESQPRTNRHSRDIFGGHSCWFSLTFLGTPFDHWQLVPCVVGEGTHSKLLIPP